MNAGGSGESSGTSAGGFLKNEFGTKGRTPGTLEDKQFFDKKSVVTPGRPPWDFKRAMENATKTTTKERKSPKEIFTVSRKKGANFRKGFN